LGLPCCFALRNDSQPAGRLVFAVQPAAKQGKQVIQRNTDCPEEQVKSRIPRKSKSWRFAQGKTVLRAAPRCICSCDLWLNLLFREIRVTLDFLLA
jgi:hypothetical protein